MTSDPTAGEGYPGKELPVAPHIRNAVKPADASSDIFFAAVETTRMPMIVTDPNQADNPIVFCNDAFEFMTGYTQDEIVGSNCRFLQGPETDRATIDQIRDAIAARREVAVEVLNYRKNGSTFWNALFVSPVYDDDGNLRYFFGSQLDISRRREAEEALHQAQKMEAVGKLTGGIAHDFNNLLQVILGYVDILEARIDEANRPARRAIDAIAMAASRGATLTQQLLAFARKQELSDRLLNFSSLIGDFGPIIERTVGEGITLRRQLDDNLWNCRVDPVQAEMALINILSNARDALNDSGVITIATHNVVVPKDEVTTDKLENGEYIVVSITDDGPGVPDDIIDRIFDPFFSTKEVGKGTGLGLAMVYGFMRQSGGVATVRNRVEGGAEFRLYFPRSTGAVDRKVAHAKSAKPGGAERILMVEDQKDVAELGRTMLEDLGYTVEHAADARSALDLLTKDSDFRLLFTDIIMPGGMNGVALAQQVKRDFPNIAVLLTTGFSDDAFQQDGARAFELIRKPYRRAELDQMLRAVLDKPGART